MSSFRYPKTLTKSAAGTYVNGVYVPGVETQIQILATVQPAPGDMMKRAPEGRQNESGYVVFSDSEINVAAPGSINADIMEVGGVRYEAVLSEAWQNGVISHYRALFLREKP